MTDTELLTTPQVAQQLGVHTSTVHRWATDGRLVPELVAGKVRMFSQAEVDRFVTDARIVR